MIQSPNPYLNRTAIKNDRNFFGRHREIATIINRVNADDPQSISIIGERRIGKSSLLQTLLRQKHKYLRRPDEYVFLYSDLQERMHGNVNDFFSLLMGDVALTSHFPEIAEKTPTYENFRKLAVDLTRSRIKLVLLLDEFDAITQNKNFGLDFFSFLRSLPNNYAVSYVITSAHDLLRYCHSQEIAGSPFFNIFHKMNLGCFLEEEAMELITGSSGEAGHSLKPHAAFILKLAGRFPFFLQLACCALFEYLETRPSKDVPDWQFIRKQFYTEARDHFQYLWNHFSKRERIVCEKIIRHQEFDKSDRTFLDSLIQRGYIQETAEGPSLFSDVFRTYLQEIDLQQTPRAQPDHKLSSDSSIQTYETNRTMTLDLSGIRVGRFMVKELLGSGAMGNVYLAEDTVLKRSVALKRISPVYKEDPDYRRRFLKEAERASQLSDPNIACIYDLLDMQGELFLVMEYVNGKTLRKFYAEPLHIMQLLDIAQQCANALTSAHTKGIVHCDIKPENILLNSSGQVKILDFGLAKFMPKHSDSPNATTADITTELFGCTPSYAAPEYLLESKADMRSDIFSLGIVFYEALGGQHPFLSSTWAQTIDRIIHLKPASLRELNPEVVRNLEDIVNKCLEKSPGNRYQNAALLAKDLFFLSADYNS